MFEIELIPCLSDNYAVLLHNHKRQLTALIDAPEAAPIARVLEAKGWGLDVIAITHKHPDHVAGVQALWREGMMIYAPQEAVPFLPRISHIVQGGERVDLAGFSFEVIAAPGHTAGHVCYHSPEATLLFAGDTLFSLGCGRLLGGTMEALYASVQTLARLPDATQIYCGHEYTLANAAFALAQEPESNVLQQIFADLRARRTAGQPTLPTTIAFERAHNPFLRAGSFEDFAALRERRNVYSFEAT